MLTILDIDIRIFVQILIGAINFAIGVLVLLRDWKNPSNQSFAAIATSIALWTFTRVIFQLAPPGVPLEMVAKFLFVTSGLLPFFLIPLVMYIGDSVRRIPLKGGFFIMAPWLGMTLLAVFTDKIVNTVTIDLQGGYSIVYGDGFYYFAVYMVTYLLTGLYILIRRYIETSGIVKTQLRYVLTGAFISIPLGITTNLLLPLLGIMDYVWLGPIGTVALVSFISVAMTRHRLWNFRIVATEIFVFFLLIILLVQIFIADTPEKMLIRIGTFFLISLFSFFLIRESLRELKTQNRIQQLSRTLMAANSRLREIDVQKSDFVSIASHQLRTPLTVIKGYTSMLLEGTFGAFGNERHRSVVDKIYRSSEHLVTMIDDFLNITRIERGQMSYAFAKIDLSNVVREIVEDVKVSAKSEGLTILYEPLREEGEYSVVADHLKVAQVVSNLLDNAIKYTPRGGTITIRITKDPGTENTVLAITDTGMGIAPETMPRLFQRFSRDMKMAHLHGEGSGLGLYIARQIMDAHNGSIRAESPGVGKGATFFISFPKTHGKLLKEEIKSFTPKPNALQPEADHRKVSHT